MSMGAACSDPADTHLIAGPLVVVAPFYRRKRAVIPRRLRHRHRCRPTAVCDRRHPSTARPRLLASSRRREGSETGQTQSRDRQEVVAVGRHANIVFRFVYHIYQTS